jgi:hypothetical protein
MSFAQRFVVDVLTNASGDGVGYTPALTGKVSAIHYVKDDFANGVDFTITAEATGETIWAQENVNASASVAPRQATHSTAGVAAVYAAGGEAVRAPIALAGDRVKIVVAQGGNAKRGRFHVVIE